MAPMTDRQLVRAVWTTVALAVLVPPFAGAFLMGVAGFYPMPQVFLIFFSYTGLYCLACLVFAAWGARRLSTRLVQLGQLAADQPKLRDSTLLARLPWHLFGGVLTYCIIGALSASFSLDQMGHQSYDLRGYLYSLFGVVPVILVTVSPVFFYFTDQLGRYFGPRGFDATLVSMSLKLVVLGILTPLMIDSFLIGYYINHTGLFNITIFAIWLSLMILASAGTWLAHRSFRQGLSPLQDMLAGQVDALNTAKIASIKPQSIDEFGALTRLIAEQLARQNTLAEHLLESETLLQSVIENANALIVLLDPKGRIVLFNKACEELSGYSRDEVRGKFPWDIVLPTSERDTVREEAFAALADNPQGLRSRYTNHWQTKDGALRMIDWANSLLLNGAGDMRYMISFGIDVTEKQAVADALLRAQETFARAEEITHIGSWDWDIVTGELRWSDEIYRIFSVTPQSFGATYDAFLSYIHPDDRQAVIDAVNAAVADPAQTYSVRHRVLRPDGTIRLVHERGMVYRENNGKPLRMIGTVHDITEQNAMEERLNSALLEKDLLLKEVYHRVKNNLQVISSLMTLQSGYSTDQKLRAMLRESANRVVSMALVHEQLYQSDNLVHINFQAYVEELAANLSEHTELASDITISSQISDIRIGVQFAVPMGLIINELVSNAFKHAFTEQRSGGEITLRLVRIPDNGLEMAVTDNGRGWPDGFEPTSTDTLGFRLVLALCEQLGASYSFESGPEGGACFVMRFMLELEESAPTVDTSIRL